MGFGIGGHDLEEVATKGEDLLSTAEGVSQVVPGKLT